MKSICTFLFAFGQSASLIKAAKKEGGNIVVYGSLQGQQHGTDRESLSFAQIRRGIRRT